MQRILAAMAERRMAEVMGQAQRLGQILVEAQRAGHGPADLRDFDRMGQANPEMIAVGGDEYLRLVAQAAEGDRMDDPVAVALEERRAGPRGPRSSSAKARPRDCEGCAARAFASVIVLESFSILILAGVRVQLKPSTPSFSSLLTKAWAVRLAVERADQQPEIILALGDIARPRLEQLARLGATASYTRSPSGPGWSRRPAAPNGCP